MGEEGQLTCTLSQEADIEILNSFRFLLPAISTPKSPGSDSMQQQTKRTTWLVSIHKCDYGNLEGNYVLAVLHTLSHKDGKEKMIKRGRKAVGKNRGRNAVESP